MPESNSYHILEIKNVTFKSGETLRFIPHPAFDTPSEAVHGRHRLELIQNCFTLHEQSKMDTYTFLSLVRMILSEGEDDYQLALGIYETLKS